MNSPYLIGLGAGLVSAILFLSTATGSLLAMILFFLVAMPGFLAGLGWGWFAALLSGLTASIVVGLVLGPAAGLVYLATLGLPIALLCYLALLARPAGPVPVQDQGPPAFEWYPSGRLLSWAAIMAGCVAALTVPLLGFDAQTYRETAKAYFDTAIVSQLPAGDGKQIEKEKLEPFINTLVLLLPATSAMAWLGVIATNMWAAGRIAETSARAIRPVPDLLTMTYPRHFPLLFVAALLLMFTPGIVSIVATGFTGAFLVAYIIMGLTVLHAVARGSSMRPFLLTILYLSMIFISWIAVLVAIFGLGEPVFKLRERALSRRQPPDHSGE